MRKDTTVPQMQYICDRCGRINEPVKGRWAWIIMQVDGVADDETFPTGRVRSDLCPPCITSFRKWWGCS
jgi:hypothetical protein